MRILVIAHGHPNLNIGGGEKAAYSLFKYFQRRLGNEAFFLARGDAVTDSSGCYISAYPGRTNEYFLNTPSSDHFYLSCRRPEILRSFEEFLKAIQPDIVHFHHYVHLGVELLLIARTILPNATIGLTLHEYLAICNRDGQMIKTGSNGLCYSSSTLDCSRCFPDRSAIDFFLRENYIKRFFAEMDFFVSPSQFLRNRYVNWGIPEDKIVVLPNGSDLPESRSESVFENGETPNVFGFFGQINDYKGVDILVSAVESMTKEERKRIQVEIFGNINSVMQEERKNIIETGFKNFRTTIKFNGPYQAEQLSQVMRRVHWVIVPSIWWENAPLTIDEAFASRKPVICSDIGGMAEKILDGVNGFQFDVGNHRALSKLMIKCAGDKETYQRLLTNIKPPIGIDIVGTRHLELYSTARKVV